jgi:hypothetical protein
MPGLVPGIHVLGARKPKDVDGRVEPGHGDGRAYFPSVSTLRFSSSFILLTTGS